MIFVSKFPGGFSPATSGSGFLRAPASRLMAEQLTDLRKKASEAAESTNNVQNWALRALMLLLLLSLNMDALGNIQIDFGRITDALYRDKCASAPCLDVILRSVDIWEPIMAVHSTASSQITRIIVDGVLVALQQSRPIDNDVLRTALEYDVVHDAGEISDVLFGSLTLSEFAPGWRKLFRIYTIHFRHLTT